MCAEGTGKVTWERKTVQRNEYWYCGGNTLFMRMQTNPCAFSNNKLRIRMI